MKCDYRILAVLLFLTSVTIGCGGRYDSGTPGGVGGGGNGGGIIITTEWEDPADFTDAISPLGGGDVETSAVAMDGNGNAIIAWSQSDGTEFHIYKSEYRNGSWDHPSNIMDFISPAGTDALNPAVAMDDRGNAIIAWQQSDGEYYQIFISEYRDGRWKHPVSFVENISPDNRPAYSPKVAMDDNGNAIIVWTQTQMVIGVVAVNNVFRSEYRDGSWSHPATIYEGISLDREPAYSPRVAMSNNGDAIIVWEQYRSNSYYVYFTEYRNGAWSGIAEISPYGLAGAPEVAMNNTGDAIIVWEEWNDNSGEWQIYKSEYREGAWVHPANANDSIDLPDISPARPVVAMSDSGEAVIAYLGYNGRDDQVFISEYRDGEWDDPDTPDDHISPDGTDASFPRVAMDQDGNTVVAWLQFDAGVGHVFRSEYREGEWTHPEDLADRISLESQAFEPEVQMSNAGTALIVWPQLNVNTYSLYRSEYGF